MKLKRIATVTATCGLIAGALVTATMAQGTAAPAQRAAACQNVNVTLYPGSQLTPRYGEWSIDALVCPTKKPSSWKTQTSVELNATASNLAMTVLDEPVLSIAETGSNQWNNYARYEATFKSQSCTPKVGWPCWSTNTWRVWLTITADKNTHEVKTYLQKKEIPPTFGLWSTP
ncbi:hypothetical protein ABTZ59_32870 [Streptomyces sp. NPDC094034]|uniref:hypothetical protein n=1 Tax=Streptomyces sp. NPDC094034 TaxID=3155309 RepID=UPI00332734F8